MLFSLLLGAAHWMPHAPRCAVRHYTAGAFGPWGKCQGADRVASLPASARLPTVLLCHPAVADAAVVGVPDRFWGEVVGAAIRPAPGHQPTEAELAELCRARLAGFKTPARWLFTTAFPLTATGKIRKDVLGAQLARAAEPAGSGS